MAPDELPDAHCLVAGSSCVPFSRNGKKIQFDDVRALSFSSCIRAVEHLAHRPSKKLQLFVIENVAALADKPADSDTCPLTEVMDLLGEKLGPRWSTWFWKVSLEQMGLPQNRVRLFICGRRVDSFKTPLPRCSPCDFWFRPLPLECILDASLPVVKRLTENQRENLNWYRSKHESESAQPCIICCDLSRAPGKVRAPLSMRGRCMTLTTRLTALFVFETHTHRFQRWLSDRERCMLQGFSGDTASRLGSHVVRFTGNAMGMPVIGMVLACAWGDIAA